MHHAPVPRNWVRLILPICLLVATGSAVAAQETKLPTAGRLLLFVRGKVRDIVVADPDGKLDRQTDSTAIKEIPGCSRWPGGLGGDELNPERVGEHESAVTEFQLATVQYGRYVVSAVADVWVPIELAVTYEAADGSPTSCVDLTRKDRVGLTRRAWAVEVRRTVPKGECAVKISRLPKYRLTEKHSAPHP